MEELLKKKSGTMGVEIKPNSPETKILSYNKETGSFKIAVKSPPTKGRANLELVKFLSKTIGKKVRLKSGHTGKRKDLEII